MMKGEETSPSLLGSYLLDRLFDQGVQHIFGLPGDYILRFDKLIEEHPIQFINTTREDTAGYMGDAYGRLKGLGAVCITYGVGLTVVNAVAQAYTESSPLVIISGAPGKGELKQSIFRHHLIQNEKATFFENKQLEILKPITVYQAILDNPQTAAQEIEKAIATAKTEQKPVYIEIPRDNVMQPIPVPYAIIPEKPDPDMDLKALKTLLEKASHPILWTGHEIQRYRLASPILAFAERYSIPIVTTLLGKSAFDERHPLVLGVFQGDLSRPELVSYLAKCDAALFLGLIESDVDTGIFTAKLPTHQVYQGATLLKLTELLPTITLKSAKSPPSYPKSPPLSFLAKKKQISHNSARF